MTQVKIEVTWRDKLAAAKYRLQKEQPYFALALYSLKTIEVQGLKTFATDEWWRLYVDPAAAESWEVEAITTVLEHELGHLLRNHAQRCRTYEAHPRVWNIAGDLEINDNLVKAGKKFPTAMANEKDAGFVHPKMWNWPEDLLAEEYYLRMHKENKVQYIHQPSIGGGMCGSCASGQKESWELDPSNKENPGIRPAQGDLIRKQVAEEIMKSQSRGTIPGDWERWAKELLQPKINWKNVLAVMVRDASARVAGMADYTYMRRSRRSSAQQDIILPGLYRPVPELIVILDTSGSMSDKFIQQGITEVAAILRQNGLRTIRFMAADAAVHFCKEIANWKQAKALGGGGTDMALAIDEALRIRPKPNLIIVITDAITPWPNDKPSIPTIIVHMGTAGQLPPWAKKVVTITDQDIKN